MSLKETSSISVFSIWRTDLTARITEVSLVSDGSGAKVSLVFPEGEKRVYTVLESCYEDWKKAEGKTISEEEVASLESLSEYRKAFIKALQLLEYGELTEKGLAFKLRARGFSSESIETAVAQVKAKGLIREEDFADRAVRYYVEKKNYGRARIMAEMFKKGFSKDSVDSALGKVADEEIVEACRKQICRNRSLAIKLAGDAANRNKAYAALIRQGFTVSEIKEAEKTES